LLLRLERGLLQSGLRRRRIRAFEHRRLIFIHEKEKRRQTLIKLIVSAILFYWSRIFYP
jgi:hypothetical protein